MPIATRIIWGNIDMMVKTRSEIQIAILAHLILNRRDVKIYNRNITENPKDKLTAISKTPYALLQKQISADNANDIQIYKNQRPQNPVNLPSCKTANRRANKAIIIPIVIIFKKRKNSCLSSAGK